MQLNRTGAVAGSGALFPVCCTVLQVPMISPMLPQLDLACVNRMTFTFYRDNMVNYRLNQGHATDGRQFLVQNLTRSFHTSSSSWYNIRLHYKKLLKQRWKNGDGIRWSPVATDRRGQETSPNEKANQRRGTVVAGWSLKAFIFKIFLKIFSDQGCGRQVVTKSFYFLIFFIKYLATRSVVAS